MFVVYWTVVLQEIKMPKRKEFQTNEMHATLHLMESLRNKQREDGSVCHITMSSENPNSVGRPGVAEAGAEYNWKKRRI
jgi:hypothetical protein